MNSHRFKPLICIIFLIVVTPLSFLYAEENGSVQSKTIGSDVPIDQSGLSSTKDLKLEEEPESFFQIRFVSPELLDTIRANSGSDDEILKVGPGMMIGIASPQMLYLRSDLQSDEFLIKNQNSTDLKEKISDHLLDIAFGRDNSNLSILKKDLKYKFWFDAIYTQKDIDSVLRFGKMFNNLSSTTQFEDKEVVLGDLKNNYEVIPYNYYNIRIVDKQYLDDYKKDKYKSKSEIILKNKSGDMIGILSGGYAYLWDGLSGNDRDYYLTKSLLWSIGLHGETSTYPDSFFYTKANTSSALSSLDKEVIKLMYGGRLHAGMTADEVRNSLNLLKLKQ